MVDFFKGSKMNRMVVLLIFASFLSISLSEVWAIEDLTSSTTRSYEENTSVAYLKNREGGPRRKRVNVGRSESDHRSFHSDPSQFNLHNTPEDLNKLTLREFLELYAKRPVKRPEEQYDTGSVHNLEKLIQDQSEKVNSKDKSKSWTLLDVQKHKHPFEDKKGWVSLEPIPWSVSKISKWQSKYKPVTERPWDEHGPISSQRPYLPDDVDFDLKRPVSITPPSPYVYYQQPTESSDRYDTYYEHVDRPKPTPLPNIYSRPAALYGHKVHVEAHFPSNSYSSTGKPYPYHMQKDCHHPNHPYEEIMTDGLPSNFPEPSRYDSLRRRGTEMEIHPDTHPLTGDGEWVLLSTTKGYKPPRSRQRSIDLGANGDTSQAIRTSRGIRLTVLPPLAGSKVNMTTSHGGLLQVESTFESVEQAKQKFDKKQNRLKIKGKRKRRKNLKKPKPVGETQLKPVLPVEETHQTVATISKNGNDPGALMAAVGAGMIPATMAMMVPIALSGG